LSLEELAGASEAFITSSLMELMPVGKVGDMVLSECPGAVTVRLLDAYRKLVYSWLYG
jgi:branched-subunit amino acid aminotransferase/4-amino-4-deoxychorismate lyase